MSKKINKETLTLNQIISYFESFTTRHQQLNDFGYGSITQLENSQYLEYPSMWVFLDDTNLVNNGRNGFSELQMNFQILIMDEVDQDEDMIQEVQSDALTIANDLVAEFSYNRFYQDQWIKISDDVTINPFREDFKSRVAGQRVEFTITMNFTNCYVLDPIDDIPSYSAQTITARANTISEGICDIVQDCSLEFSKNIVFEQDVEIKGDLTVDGQIIGDGSQLSGISTTSSFSGLTDTDLSGLTNGDVAIYESGSGKWKNKSKEQSISYIDVYDTDMNGTSIPGSGIDITLDTVRYVDGSFYTHSDPEVTIEKDGVYKIDYNINTKEGGRATSRGQLHLDTGSGYSKVPGSAVYMYNRVSGNGYNTGGGQVVLELSAGDKLKLRAYQNTGGGSTMANESSLVIQNTIDGIVGPKGEQGDPGSLNGTVFTGGFQMTDTVLTNASGTITTDLSQSNIFNITLTGDATLDYTNISESGTFQWIINQDSTGGHSLSYTSGKFQASEGTIEDIYLSPNSKSLIQGIYDDLVGKMLITLVTNYQDI